MYAIFEAMHRSSERIKGGFNHEGNAEEEIMFMSSLKEIFTDQLGNKEVVKGEGEPPSFTST
jgi:hypothetical protein